MLVPLADAWEPVDTPELIALLTVCVVLVVGSAIAIRRKGIKTPSQMTEEHRERIEAKGQRSVFDLSGMQLAIFVSFLLAIGTPVAAVNVAAAVVAWALVAGLAADVGGMRTELVEWRRAREFDTTPHRLVFEFAVVALFVTGYAIYKIS